MTAPTGPAEPKEPPFEALTDDDELLFRQVHPASIPGGVMQKTAFWPGSADNGLLSTRRQALGGQGAYELHVKLGGTSVGSYAVTVGEVTRIPLKDKDGQPASLRVLDDAAREGEHHASIDYQEDALSRGQREQAARKLVEAAVARGCQYVAPAD